ncbi:hypothetical protein ACCO45_000190 [Purpureocillium lilacinum]|uniref:Uncharacterized protein n=1 Tax=Purpureocillium lilacinum TaxID=33203 RepID=A0ACC4E3Z2_PURLI
MPSTRRTRRCRPRQTQTPVGVDAPAGPRPWTTSSTLPHSAALRGPIAQGIHGSSSSAHAAAHAPPVSSYSGILRRRDRRGQALGNRPAGTMREGGNKMLSRARRMPSPSLFNPPAGQLHVRCDSKDVLRHGLPVAPCIHTLKAARPTRRTASALDNVIQVRRPATSPPSTTLPRAPPERARDKNARPSSGPAANLALPMTRFPDVAALTSTNFAFVSFSLASLSSLLRLALFGSPCSPCCSARARFGYRKLNVGVSAQTVRGPEPFAHSAALRLPHTRCRNSASEAPWALA